MSMNDNFRWWYTDHIESPEQIAKESDLNVKLEFKICVSRVCIYAMTFIIRMSTHLNHFIFITIHSKRAELCMDI